VFYRVVEHGDIESIGRKLRIGESPANTIKTASQSNQTAGTVGLDTGCREPLPRGYEQFTGRTSDFQKASRADKPAEISHALPGSQLAPGPLALFDVRSTSSSSRARPASRDISAAGIPLCCRFCRGAIACYVVKETSATAHQRPIEAPRSKDEFRRDRAAEVARERIEC
jgi:hypothetical protein